MSYNIAKNREEKIADLHVHVDDRRVLLDNRRYWLKSWWGQLSCCWQWFFFHFPGALNHQTTHHLFPGVSQIYYPEITPIVRETCKEFGVRYNYKDTFFQALGSHIGHLKRLGQQTQQHKFTSSRNDWGFFNIWRSVRNVGNLLGNNNVQNTCNLLQFITSQE